MVTKNPEFPLLLFGDGLTAEIREGPIQSKNDYGISIYSFVIKPTMDLIQRHRLKDKLDRDGLITVSYPKVYVRIMNSDQIIGRTLVKCSFNHQSTPISQENEVLCNIIISMEQVIYSIDGQISDLQRELRLSCHKKVFFESIRDMNMQTKKSYEGDGDNKQLPEELPPAK